MKLKRIFMTLSFLFLKSNFKLFNFHYSPAKPLPVPDQ